MMKKLLFSTVAYTVSTFVLAVLWHVVLFEETYRSFAYLNGEPNFLLGFLSILSQGFLLSWLYPHLQISGGSMRRALTYTGILGLFFWTSHVLAFIAKEPMNDPLLFLGMESFYLVLQFGIFGVLLGLIQKKHS